MAVRVASRWEPLLAYTERKKRNPNKGPTLDYKEFFKQEGTKTVTSPLTGQKIKINTLKGENYKDDPTSKALLKKLYQEWREKHKPKPSSGGGAPSAPEKSDKDGPSPGGATEGKPSGETPSGDSKAPEKDTPAPSKDEDTSGGDRSAPVVVDNKEKGAPKPPDPGLVKSMGPKAPGAEVVKKWKAGKPMTLEEVDEAIKMSVKAMGEGGIIDENLVKVHEWIDMLKKLRDFMEGLSGEKSSEREERDSGRSRTREEKDPLSDEAQELVSKHKLTEVDDLRRFQKKYESDVKKYESGKKDFPKAKAEYESAKKKYDEARKKYEEEHPPPKPPEKPEKPSKEDKAKYEEAKKDYEDKRKEYEDKAESDLPEEPRAPKEPRKPKSMAEARADYIDSLEDAEEKARIRDMSVEDFETLMKVLGANRGKTGSLGVRVVRLAYARPDLRPLLLSALSTSEGW